MSHKGGWKDYGGGGWGEPHEPESDLIVSEGRFRCIRRVEGRIQEILWTRETAGAESVYEQERQRAQQRELMEEMSTTELNNELIDPDRLTAVPYEEIRSQYEKQQEEKNEDTNQGYIQIPEIDIAY